MSAQSGLLFHIDSPRLADGAPLRVDGPLDVAGWMLPPPGRSLRAIELRVGDDVVAHASLGIERPDVLNAFPGRAGALRSGFNAQVPPGRLNGRDDRSAELTVHALWDGGRAVLSRILLAAGRDPDLDQVSRFWEEQFEARRRNGSYWVNNPIIEQSIYRLMTGGPYHWLGWLMSHYFAGIEAFDRALSICCGDGCHELELLKGGKVRHLTGFDISGGAVQQAVERIRGAGFSDDRFKLDVRDANRLELEGQFDLIFSVGAVHHVENLEGLMETVSRVLDPGGYFVLVEFIGPDRFQWTDKQITIINGALGALDPQYLLGGGRTTFARPGIDEMIRIDPSEAVRSSEILGLVRRHFSVAYERPFNGTLLHQLYPLLNADLADGGHPDFDSIVRLLLYFEDVLIREGVLDPDFVFLICQPRSAAS